MEIQIPIDEVEFRCYRGEDVSCSQDKRVCVYCTHGRAITTTRLATPDEVAEIYIESRNW